MLDMLIVYLLLQPCTKRGQFQNKLQVAKIFWAKSTEKMQIFRFLFLKGLPLAKFSLLIPRIYLLHTNEKNMPMT